MNGLCYKAGMKNVYFSCDQNGLHETKYENLMRQLRFNNHIQMYKLSDRKSVCFVFRNNYLTHGKYQAEISLQSVLSGKFIYVNNLGKHCFRHNQCRH